MKTLLSILLICALSIIYGSVSIEAAETGTPASKRFQQKLSIYSDIRNLVSVNLERFAFHSRILHQMLKDDSDAFGTAIDKIWREQGRAQHSANILNSQLSETFKEPKLIAQALALYAKVASESILSKYEQLLVRSIDVQAKTIGELTEIFQLTSLQIKSLLDRYLTGKNRHLEEDQFLAEIGVGFEKAMNEILIWTTAGNHMTQSHVDNFEHWAAIAQDLIREKMDQITLPKNNPVIRKIRKSNWFKRAGLVGLSALPFLIFL